MKGPAPGVINLSYKGCESGQSKVGVKFKEFEYLDGSHTKEKLQS